MHHPGQEVAPDPNLTLAIFLLPFPSCLHVFLSSPSWQGVVSSSLVAVFVTWSSWQCFIYSFAPHRNVIFFVFLSFR